MAWRDRLQPGKFREAPFLIESSELAGGRRAVVHEYPQRDRPYAEDLGRKARDYPVECYVVGADYMDARDALIAALEAAGAGTLVHPYHGAQRVMVRDYRCRESTAEGGMARFSITFVENGEQLQPTASAATGTLVESRADAAQSALAAAFDGAFSLARTPEWVSDAAETLSGNVLAQIGQVASSLPATSIDLSSLQRSLSAATGGLDALLRTPGGFPGALQGIVQQLGGALPNPADAFGALTSLADFDPGAIAVPLTTASRLLQSGNQTALLGLFRGSSVIEAVRVVARNDIGAVLRRVLPGAVSGLGTPGFASYQDAIGLRDDLSGRLDGLIDVADDAAYNALTALKVAMVRDINARGASLARVIDYTPHVTQPALALAYSIYGDATREAEIAVRNGASHPGFLTGGRAIEVLARG